MLSSYSLSLSFTIAGLVQYSSTQNSLRYFTLFSLYLKKYLYTLDLSYRKESEGRRNAEKKKIRTGRKKAQARIYS